MLMLLFTLLFTVLLYSCNCITIASTSISTYLKARWAAVEVGVTGSGSSAPLSERGSCLAEVVPAVEQVLV
jgi:hypothetical protein